MTDFSLPNFIGRSIPISTSTNKTSNLNVNSINVNNSTFGWWWETDSPKFSMHNYWRLNNNSSNNDPIK